MLQTPTSSAAKAEFTDFESFLRRDGFHLNIGPEEAREQMREVFSTTTWDRFQELMEIRKERPYTSEELYTVPETLQEAALLFSPMSPVVSACGQQLWRTLKEHLSPGIKVADMGCGIGSWTRWMAEHHPNVGFVGFDGHHGLLNIASEANQLNNCQFVECEYGDLSKAYGQFDVVASLLGIDFEPGPFNPNPEELMADTATEYAITRFYQRTFASAAASWRKVLQPKGCVMAVLRLSCFEAWYGCLAGAMAEGLRFNPQASSCIAVGKQRFPLLVFEATDSIEMLDMDSLLTWWAERTGASADAQVLLDAAALWRYRSLKDKKILEETEEQYEDGHVMRKETGIAEGVGYVYE
ncbi:MAG: class I SAM-dependent methyltransferase, partial [Nitrosomonas sp.]